MTTEEMRSVLSQMHGDSDWKRYCKKMSARQVRDLYSSAKERGQITNIKPLPVNSQLDITDVFGIPF